MPTTMSTASVHVTDAGDKSPTEADAALTTPADAIANVKTAVADQMTITVTNVPTTLIWTMADAFATITGVAHAVLSTSDHVIADVMAASDQAMSTVSAAECTLIVTLQPASAYVLMTSVSTTMDAVAFVKTHVHQAVLHAAILTTTKNVRPVTLDTSSVTLAEAVEHVSHAQSAVPLATAPNPLNAVPATTDSISPALAPVNDVHHSVRNVKIWVKAQYAHHAHLTHLSRMPAHVFVIHLSYAIVLLACALSNAGGEKSQLMANAGNQITSLSYSSKTRPTPEASTPMRGALPGATHPTRSNTVEDGSTARTCLSRSTIGHHTQRLPSACGLRDTIQTELSSQLMWNSGTDGTTITMAVPDVTG